MEEQQVAEKPTRKRQVSVHDDQDSGDHTSSTPKQTKTEEASVEPGMKESGFTGFKGYKSTSSNPESPPYWIQFSPTKSVHHGISKVTSQILLGKPSYEKNGKKSEQCPFGGGGGREGSTPVHSF